MFFYAIVVDLLRKHFDLLRKMDFTVPMYAYKSIFLVSAASLASPGVVQSTNYAETQSLPLEGKVAERSEVG